MKKLLLAATFLFGATLAFTSCNNGAYDADPNADLSGISNPLDVPGGAYNMSCHVDGETYTGRANFIGTNNLGILSINSTGTLTNDTAEYQIQVGVMNYSVPGTYSEPDSTLLFNFGPRYDPFNSYTNTGAGNTCTITITDFTSDYVNGTFSGRVRNGGSYHNLTDGTFHVRKL